MLGFGFHRFLVFLELFGGSMLKYVTVAYRRLPYLTVWTVWAG